MAWFRASFLAGYAASFLLGISAAIDGDPPTLETYRDGTEKRIGAALDAAADHLAWFLGVSKDSAEGKKKFPWIFKRYELDMNDPVHWREDCAFDLDSGNDHVEWCAARKLQALELLCSEPHLVARVGKRGLRAALKALEKQGETIVGLNILRSAPPGTEGYEGFVYEVDRVGSGQKLLSPMLHAVAMSTVARCGAALGTKEFLDVYPHWITSLDMAVDRAAGADFDSISHHNLAVVVQSLSYLMLQSNVKLKGPAADRAKHAFKLADQGVRAQFKDNAQTWSYAAANAVGIRLGSDQLKDKERRKLEKLGRLYADRFLGVLLKGLNTSLHCTCGPITGLAPLAAELGDVSLAGRVLELMEKNIEMFQVAAGGFAKASPEKLVPRDASEAAKLQGAFVRSPEQLRLEKRPRTLRIDDTLTCLAALSESRRMAEKLLRVKSGSRSATSDEL